jgi:hypothetical protein
MRPGREPFARPMPYEVSWLRDGKHACVRTFSYSKAGIVFEHERKEGREPELYVGGMPLAGPVIEESARAVFGGGE